MEVTRLCDALIEEAMEVGRELREVEDDVLGDEVDLVESGGAGVGEVGVDLGDEGRFIRSEELCGGGRCVGGKVGGEVGERGVSFVADAGEDEVFAGGDSADERLVVEGGEVITAATTANNSNCVVGFLVQEV